MKAFIIFVYSLVFSISFSQKQLEDYYLQRNLKQEGEQYQFQILDEDKKGVWFHRKDKFYFWYKAQHVISTQGGSSGLLLNGNFESFYEKKQLSKKGKFRKGLKSGEWLYWRKDGTLRITETWSNGEMKIRTLYDQIGTEKEKITFKGKGFYKETNDTVVNSKRNGKKQTIIIKDSQGQVVRVEQKKNGQLHGKVKSYSNGELTESEEYKDGVLMVKEDEDDTKIRNQDKKTKKSLKDIFKRKDKKEDPIKSKEPQKNEKEVKPKKKRKKDKSAE